jgi:hypothetical protein
MQASTRTNPWWEVAVVALAANSVVFGVLATGNGHPGWAIATGFAPAALLLTGLALRGRWRSGATAMVIVASLAAAAWFWMVYPAVLAAIVIGGGLANGEIGPRRSEVSRALPCTGCDEEMSDEQRDQESGRCLL